MTKHEDFFFFLLFNIVYPTAKKKKNLTHSNYSINIFKLINQSMEKALHLKFEDLGLNSDCDLFLCTFGQMIYLWPQLPPLKIEDSNLCLTCSND